MFVAELYGSNFNHSVVIGPRNCQLRWNNAKLRPLRCPWSFKVTSFGTNRKPVSDFLRVNVVTCTVSEIWRIISPIFAVDRGRESASL